MDFQNNKFDKQQKNGNGSLEKDKMYTENHLEKEMDIDYDIIHLKDHLNASFDKDNIVVSEELIQKTLQAIQSGKAPLTAEEEYQQDNDVIDYESRKKNRWSIFRLASIAAVLMLLLVGLNVFEYLQSGNKKDMAVKENRMSGDVTESDMVSMAESTTENKAMEKGTNGNQKAAEEYSITADTAKDAPEESKSNDEFTTNASDAKEETEAQEAPMGLMMEGNILFSDILPFTAEQVTSFDIINSKKETISYGNLDKTKEILLLLNEYPLALIENEEDTLEQQWDYQIKFTTKDNKLYTILVGNEILLKTDDNNNDIIRYSIIGDVEQLKSSLNKYTSK